MNFNALNLKWCADLLQAEGRCTTRHNHTFFQILYIKSGSGTLYFNDKELPLTAGDFYIFKPLEYHEFFANKGGMNTYEAKFDISDSVLYKKTLELNTKIGVKPVYFERVFADLVYEYSFGGEETETVKTALFTELLIHLIRCDNKNSSSNKGGENPFLKIARYIEKHYHEDIKLDTLAEMLHMEKSYFIKQFKKHIGLTPMAYFKKIKIDAAMELIKNSDMNITQISEYLGYGSIHHFSNAFKNQTGISPKEYSETKTDRVVL